MSDEKLEIHPSPLKSIFYRINCVPHRIWETPIPFIPCTCVPVECFTCAILWPIQDSNVCLLMVSFMCFFSSFYFFVFVFVSWYFADRQTSHGSTFIIIFNACAFITHCLHISDSPSLNEVSNVIRCTTYQNSIDWTKENENDTVHSTVFMSFCLMFITCWCFLCRSLLSIYIFIQGVLFVSRSDRVFVFAVKLRLLNER